MHTAHLDIAALSIAERIELAQELWASVREELESAPLPPDQVAEVQRRLAELDSGLAQCEPFDTVMRRLSRG